MYAGINATTTKEIYAAVWEDVAKMEAVVSYCVAIGTDRILDGKDCYARRAARFACFFEQILATSMQKKQPVINTQKVLELNCADNHTLVKYFRKRIPCKCLDEKYKQFKSVTKMGFCSNLHCGHPDGKVERSKMFYCTRCGMALACYCSRDCQTAH